MRAPRLHTSLLRTRALIALVAMLGPGAVRGTAPACAWDVESGSRGNALELELYNLDREGTLDGIHVAVTSTPAWIGAIRLDAAPGTMLAPGAMTPVTVGFDVAADAPVGASGEIMLAITGTDGFACAEAIPLSIVAEAEGIQSDCCSALEISTTGVEPGVAGAVLPATLAIESFPNPSNPGAAVRGTTIRFALASAAETEVTIHDVRGRLVRTLATGRRDAGMVELGWDGRLAGGEPAPSGLYFVRVRAGERVETAKLVLTQ
jgi:hypothetical protein